MLHKKVITNRQFNYLCPPDEPRPRRFYMLPKIHKPPSEWTITQGAKPQFFGKPDMACCKRLCDKNIIHGPSGVN